MYMRIIKPLFRKFKKHFLFFPSIFCLLLLLYWSCTRIDYGYQRSKDFSVADAKEWWFGTFKKSGDYNYLDPNSLYTPKLELGNNNWGIKDPSWLNAKAYSIGQIKVVELPLIYRKGVVIIPDGNPLSNADFVRTANSIVSKCLIIRLADGKIVVRVLQITPSFKHAKQKGFDVSENSSSFIQSDFDGYYMVRNWNESQVKNWRIQNGKKLGGFLFQKQTHSPRSQAVNIGGVGSHDSVGFDAMPQPWWVALNNAINNQGGFECTSYSTSGDQPQLPANCVTWTSTSGGGSNNIDLPEINLDDPNTFGDCAGAVNYEECFCQTYGLGCGGGNGGYGSDGGVIEMEDSFRTAYPCQSDIIESMYNLDSFTTSIIRDLFNVNDSINMNIGYKVLPNGVDADTRIQLGGLTVNLKIRMSKFVLDSSTKEYIAVTFIHEAIHAYLYLQEQNLRRHLIDSATYLQRFGFFSWQAYNVNDPHHVSMANSYITHMANAVRNYNPLVSDTIANALAWGGLSGTSAWQSRSDTNFINVINYSLRNQGRNSWISFPVLYNSYVTICL
jgi:hypothetical protein